MFNSMYKMDKAQLSSFQEGTPITVQLNEAETVIDLHRFTVELSFEEHLRTKPSGVIQTDGAVTKLQSHRCDDAGRQCTISAETAPADAAVGDGVPPWVHEQNMVIDHHERWAAGERGLWVLSDR